METLNELKYILYLFWILCVVIFFIRKKYYKETDISEYYRLTNELNVDNVK